MSSSKENRPASRNYRKPPIEHRFKKGLSGNPNGRPRKRTTPHELGAFGGGIGDRLSAMALDEAARPVTVREGDKVSEIPAMQALIRTMFRAAAQGDTKAGHQLMQLISRAESGRAGSALGLMQQVLQYKQAVGPIFEKHRREGLAPPDFYPHPDDIIIDESTGNVTFDGPRTKEQAGARKAALKQSLESMLAYHEVEAALQKDPTNRELKREFKELKKYRDFLEKDAERVQRHDALRLVRRALKTEPDEPSEAISGSKHDDE
jgi:hypothetical protein